MSRTQVVITRKDKRLNKTAHLAAFVLTGGASGIVTAAKAATNAGYNARTRQLQTEAAGGSQPRGRRQKVTLTPDEIEYMKAHTAGRS